MVKGTRGQPPQDKKPTSPEKAPLGAGPERVQHNLTDDQRRALFLQGLTQIERVQAEINTLVAKKRGIYKTLKAEGTPKEEIDFALYLRKADVAEVVQRREDEARVARWLAHPIGVQADFFDGKDDKHPQDGPYEQGKTLGLAGGKPDTDRWHADSPQGQKHLEGWHAGQAILAEGFKQKVEETAPVVAPPKGMPSSKRSEAAKEGTDKPDPDKPGFVPRVVN